MSVSLYRSLALGVAKKRGASGAFPAFSLNLLSGSLDPSVSFSRLSNATMFDSQGRLVWAPSNLFRSTQNFTLSPWTALGSVAPVVTYGHPDPLGGNTASYVDVSPAADCRLAQQSVALTSIPDNAPFTYSVWLRRAPGETENFLTAAYRRKDGTVTFVSLPISDTWQRVSFSVASALTGTFLVIIWVSQRNGATATKYFAWRPQLTLGLDVLDYSENPSATAEYFGPRFDYDPLTLRARGLFIEQQRTNVLLNSDDLTSAAWTRTDITPARADGPGGAVNQAWSLTEGVAGNALLSSPNPATVVAGSALSVSLIAKRGNTDWIRVLAVDVSLANGAEAFFNLADGTAGGVVARGTGSNNSSSITSLGNEWYLISVTSTPNGTYTQGTIAVCSAAANNNSTRANNATYQILYPQVEAGSSATSRIPTFGAAATRAMDSATVDFTGIYNGAEGTFIASGEAFPSASSNFHILAGISNGSVITDVIQVGSLGNGVAFFRMDGSGVSAVNSTIAGSVIGTMRAAIAYKATDNAMARNGVFSTFGSAVLPVAANMTSLRIGGVTTVVNHSRWVSSVSYYPVRLSNAQLQALTA